jgi:flagellar biosynthetic protein FliO
MSLLGRLRGAGALVVVSLLCCCWVVTSGAADGDPVEAPAGGFLGTGVGTDLDLPPAPNLAVSAVKMLVALCVVLGLVVGVALLLKRATFRMRQVGGGGITVVSRVPLGPTQFLSVVDIAGEIVVLGVTEHSVTALSSIEDTSAIAQLRADSSAAAKPGGLIPGVSGFRQILERAQRGGDT